MNLEPFSEDNRYEGKRKEEVSSAKSSDTDAVCSSGCCCLRNRIRDCRICKDPVDYVRSQCSYAAYGTYFHEKI